SGETMERHDSSQKMIGQLVYDVRRVRMLYSHHREIATMEAAQLSTQDTKLRTNSAVLAMAGVNVIWGAAFPLTKPALETIPPFTFALLRFRVALALLTPLAGRRALALLCGPDRWRLVAMGLLGFCIAQLAQTLALSLSPASDIALLSTGTPLWIALLAA